MEYPATRSVAQRLLGKLTPSAQKSLCLTVVCLLLAWLAAFLPAHAELAPPGVAALFILLFCAGLWVTEAMPAFAVSLLAIGLSITLIGKTETGEEDWEKYVATWGSPLIWLFFGGFILAAAAKKTGLDLWMARHVLSRLGDRPAVVLLGLMGTTAVLSMFLSNTATATMMVAIVGPMFVSGGQTQHVKALLLAIALAANIGGMGTLIGTPPNAIAAGTLSGVGGINFAQWMLFGVPPALLLLVVTWGYLLLAYLGKGAFLPNSNWALSSVEPRGDAPKLQLVLVVLTFTLTILMWLTSPWHGIPTTVVSFIPICLLTATRTLDAEDLKTISWDVLLLIAGGLTLGVAISDTGLATWIVAQLPLQGLPPTTVALCLAYLAVVLSNLMSNTAAANVLLPIALVLLGAEHSRLIIPIALAASAAMCLPISTPPNAIAYGTGHIKTVDLLKAGLLVGCAAPLIVTFWTQLLVAVID
ncbi:MAG: DASS family sodium-coupled anion symporter [Planctomycetota bacterium]